MNTLSRLHRRRWIRPYAKRIGVDIDNLLVSQSDTGEQARPSSLSRV
jgi:hypothetical protein